MADYHAVNKAPRKFSACGHFAFLRSVRGQAGHYSSGQVVLLWYIPVRRSSEAVMLQVIVDQVVVLRIVDTYRS